MFINFSNHPSKDWSELQIKLASEYGEIVDIEFPDVLPNASELEVKKISEKYAKEIINKNPRCVMCQGEYSMTIEVLERLWKANIKTCFACSRRNTKEIIEVDKNVKIAEFIFVKFRFYGGDL